MTRGLIVPIQDL